MILCRSGEPRFQSAVVWPHAQCLVGVWFPLPFPPPLIEAFQYVGRTLVKLDLMHACITEQKNVLLALILGYMLVLHYPSWVLNWVTELAVCWGKPDVYSKKTIVMGSGLSLKPASNSCSVFLSLFSPKMGNKKRKWRVVPKRFVQNADGDDRKVEHVCKCSPRIPAERRGLWLARRLSR